MIKDIDDVTSLPIGPAKILPCQTDSDISTRFLARVLFIALTMEVVRTSETSVWLSETARRYIAQGFHLLSDLSKLWSRTVQLK
jgi:hypothetical protein